MGRAFVASRQKRVPRPGSTVRPFVVGGPSTCLAGAFTGASGVPPGEMSLTIALAPAFLGAFTSPPVVIGVLVVLLVVLFVGRFLLGIAWRLVLIALGVVVVLWALGALGSVLALVP
jgi:hypothetical protein